MLRERVRSANWHINLKLLSCWYFGCPGSTGALLFCADLFLNHYPRIMISLLPGACVLRSCLLLLEVALKTTDCKWACVRVRVVSLSCHQLLCMLLTTMGAKVNWSAAVAVECQMGSGGRNTTNTPSRCPSVHSAHLPTTLPVTVVSCKSAELLTY